VTGRHIEGTPLTIEQRQEAINDIYQKYLETNGQQRPSQILRTIPMDDESLIAKAMKARNGAKFKALWDGNWQGTYRSQSEAELALCSMLAFWTQGERGQIDHLFRNSGLYREKWDKKHGEKSYGEITIDKALSNLTSTYSPKTKINTGEEEQVVEVEHFTDMGNARRFVKTCGDVIRYCHEWNAWLIWDGRRWQLDKTGEIFRLAKKTVQGIYEEAGKINSEGLRKEVAKHAIRSEARIKLEAMVALANSEPGIPLATEKMDQDQWKLNVLNGTIDLRTGSLLPHSKEDSITKLIPIEYDPRAKYELWVAFLNKIMAGNQNLISFLKRAVGYSLTGDVSEQVLFFLYGTGANGKSKLLEAIMGILGQYAIQAAPDILMMKQYESHPTGLADLFGKRFVACIETEEGKRLAESLVKQMTGGDRMKARFMRQDFFEFAPTFKIWLAANHKPVIRGNDYAIWRRIRLIPFEVTIPAGERDKRIGDKLKAEYAGILRWAVEGCLEWQQDGLKEPDEVIAATKTYQEEMDVFGRFLGEETIQIPQAQVPANVLYTRYKEWCDENGESVISGNAFGRRMTELGFTKEHTKRGYVYKNIGLCQREE
jgi:putative DNA primase/helicase